MPHASLTAADVLLSPDALRAADQAAADAGLPLSLLMEHASRSIGEAVADLAPTGNVHLLCGTGHNGGDGLGAARWLAANGRSVTVWLVPNHDLADPTRHQLDLLRSIATLPGAEVRIEYADTPDLQDASVVIDAMLGTGAKGEPRAPFDTWIRAANQTDTLRIAVDVPTGLDAQTGRAHDTCYRADHTLTLAARSPGLVLGEGPLWTGTTRVLPIGVPEAFLFNHADDTSAIQTSDEWARDVLPSRTRGAHKFTAGSVVVIGGSDAYQGAPVISSLAAAATGAGYVTCVVPANVAASARTHLVAEVVRPAAGSPTHLSPDALSELGDVLDRANAVVIGPGLGRHEETQQFVCDFIRQADVPLVIDADALFALDTDFLASLPSGLRVLTPHAGEFERLTGEQPADDRIAQARRWNKQLGATLVLKGTPTVIADIDGTCWVAPSAPTSLATAGSGDTLAGAIAALLASTAPHAAALAVHLGCRAAESLHDQMRPEAATALELIEALRTLDLAR